MTRHAARTQNCVNISAAEPSILIVDGDEDVRELLAVLLVKRGYQVATCRELAAGLEHARRERPSLILFDLDRRGIDVHAMYDQLASDHRLADIALVAMTNARTIDRDRGPRIGVVCKPFVVDTLIAAIGAALSRQPLRSADPGCRGDPADSRLQCPSR